MSPRLAHTALTAASLTALAVTGLASPAQAAVAARTVSPAGAAAPAHDTAAQPATSQAPFAQSAHSQSPRSRSAHARPAPHPGATFHVDCSAAAGATAGSDGSARHPWTTLDQANDHIYGPGDRLLFERGTTCTGSLAPKGSGSSRAPFTIAGYGPAGDRPR